MEASRREFLEEVGKGMLVAGLGVSGAAVAGVAVADAEPPRLTFGPLEPLVDQIQSSSPDRILSVVVDRLNSGTELKRIVAAAALANARTFGGEDYIGFHTLMALHPALAMADELPSARRALPVLKVLYRNASQIAAVGGPSHEVLKPVEALNSNETNPHSLRNCTRRPDVNAAEADFARISQRGPEFSFEALQPLVEDDTDVHRVVLAYRSWSLLSLTGREHAHAMLRQTVRYCAKSEKGYVDAKRPLPEVRNVVPALLDRYHLLTKSLGSRKMDDAWIERTAKYYLTATPAQAAEFVAGSLADGISPECVGESLSLGSTLQVLLDPGRKTAYPGKPVGSVHGDSVGVHASDSMNAWRNIGRVVSQQHRAASLVVAAFHLAGKQGYTALRSIEELKPETVHIGSVRKLTEDLDVAIHTQNQAHAVELLSQLQHEKLPSRPIFDVLLKYATSEDGALHAEKYYRTVAEEYARCRPAFRWMHLAALARVTASEYGTRAAGYEEACRLLNV